MSAPLKLVDLLGNELRAGDYVVVPRRSLSEMWLEIGHLKDDAGRMRKMPLGRINAPILWGSLHEFQAKVRIPADTVSDDVKEKLK